MIIFYVTMFGPHPIAKLSVNNVQEQPGTTGYKNAAIGWMGIGVFIALIGLILILIPVLKPQWIEKNSWGYQSKLGINSNRFNQQVTNSEDDFNQPSNYQDNFYQQSNSENFQQPPADFNEAITNIFGTSVTDDTPQPSNDYSDSYDSSYQTSDDYSDTFSSTSGSSVSDKTCSFCGAMIEPKEQFCSNCGKRL